MSPHPHPSARANSLRYPWFLETFDGYPYPIQRADAIRYFVLHHFGGIYIDLDDVRIRQTWPTLAC
jgi:mannosyltransferase OCH1-like enzyme